MASVLVCHRFVDDKTTWDIYKQFLWGPALLITPALNQVNAHALAFFPFFFFYLYNYALLTISRMRLFNHFRDSCQSIYSACVSLWFGWSYYFWLTDFVIDREPGVWMAMFPMHAGMTSTRWVRVHNNRKTMRKKKTSLNPKPALSCLMHFINTADENDHSSTPLVQQYSR